MAHSEAPADEMPVDLVRILKVCGTTSTWTPSPVALVVLPQGQQGGGGGGGGSSVGCRSSGHGARGKEPRVRFPPWAIFSEGQRGWVDWPEPAPRGSWIIAELCKWKIDCR